MISGKMPNDTVWWLSRDGLKIWIESRDLEQDKFKEKKFNIVHGRIFHSGKEVGELTTSRLDSRRHKDAWIVKLEAILDVYPELREEINRKEIEESKKKRETTSINKKKKIVKRPEIIVNKDESKKEILEDNFIQRPKKDLQPIKEYFEINRPYVKWITEEIDKSEKKKIVLSTKELKEKMGDEFIKMHDLRIYFGLKKVLSNIGITIEIRSVKGESMAIIKKII